MSTLRLHFTILLTLSWRNLWRNHRRTLIMLAAISVGVWAMIFMTALMRGMVDDMLKQGIRNLPGHIQIQHPAYLDDPSVVNSMAAPSGELLAALNHADTPVWATRIRVPAVIASERESRGVMLIGVEPESEAKITGLPEQIHEGRFLQSGDDMGIVIGAKLAERLETRLGKRVVVMSQDPQNNISERGFRVIGIYRAKLPALEEINIYAAGETLQRLLRIEGRVSQVVIVDEDLRHVEALYRRIGRSMPPDLEIRTWYRNRHLPRNPDQYDGRFRAGLGHHHISCTFLRTGQHAGHGGIRASARNRPDSGAGHAAFADRLPDSARVDAVACDRA